MNSSNVVQPKQGVLEVSSNPPTITACREAKRVTMLITPELAQQWLERNVRNRPMSENTVIAYGLDMLEGRWQYDGAPIRFDTDGNLIDGQHRLKACIDSGVSFENDVIFGLPPEAILTIDIHRPRTSGHIAAIKGFHNASCACAIAGLIVLHRRHGIERMNDPRCQPTKTQVVEAARTLPTLEEAVVQARLLGKKIAAPRVVGFCYYQFAAQDRAAAQRFFAELANGLGLSPDNPVYHLRERLLTDRQAKSKLPQLDIVALFFKAWLFYRNNRPLRKLFWKTDGLSPEKFPEIGEAA